MCFMPKVKAPKTVAAPVAPAPAAPISTGIKVMDPLSSTTATGSQGEVLNQGASSSSLRIPRIQEVDNSRTSLSIPKA